MSGRLLNQRVTPWKSGAAPSSGNPSCLVANRDGPRRSSSRSLDRARALERAGRVDEEAGEVVGDRGLEAHVGVGRDGERGDDHHDAHRTLQPRAAPGGADPLDQPAAEAEHEQHGRRPAEYAIATATVDPDAALTEITAARIGPAHGAYTNPSAAPTSSPLAKPWPPLRGPSAMIGDSARLDPVREARHEQQHPEAEQHDHGDRAQGPVAQADPVDDLGKPDDRDRERHREAEHDAQSAAAAHLSLRPTAARAGSAARTARSRCRRRRARRTGAGAPRTYGTAGRMNKCFACQASRSFVALAFGDVTLRRLSRRPNQDLVHVHVRRLRHRVHHGARDVVGLAAP